MKRIGLDKLERNILYFLFFIAFIAVFGEQSIAQEWQELKGEHFIVYFTGDKQFADEVSRKAEVYYRDIAMDLGYPRYKEFWTWDKRVKIYIYPQRDSFLKATGQPPWSHGMADYVNKQIISYTWGQGFTESLLPHELAHLIFRDFVGLGGEVPLWIDEGVAQWAEEAKRAGLKDKVEIFLNEDGLLSLDDMMKLNIRLVTEKNKVYIRATSTKTGDKGVVFLSADQLVSAYYLQAFSLVGFLIEKHGSTNFAQFCRELRDGKTVDEALKFAYPDSISGLDDFEKQWRKYLEEEKNAK